MPHKKHGMPRWMREATGLTTFKPTTKRFSALQVARVLGQVCTPKAAKELLADLSHIGDYPGLDREELQLARLIWAQLCVTRQRDE